MMHILAAGAADDMLFIHHAHISPHIGRYKTKRGPWLVFVFVVIEVWGSPEHTAPA
jgi:hypothetical protein